MTNDMTFTRRAALAGAAALPLTLAVGGAARAAAPMLGVGGSPFNRLKVGGFEVTTLLAGTRAVPDPQTIFGLNVSPEDFAAASQAANIPIDQAQFFFTPTLVNTGAELVLFDTGLNGPATVAALQAAGYTADQVDRVVITHMHGDHIGGLLTEGAPTYPNAAYVTGAAEFNAWDMAGNDAFEANVRPLAEQFTFLDDGGSVASGLTAMAAFGHTPGHMAYMVESEGTQLLIGADFANHYVWSLAHPDWEVRFDRDKEAAADKVALTGYHMPWPGVGYVETRGDGFHFVPHSYQLML